MDWATTISTTVAALITLGIFSFLYKDNPFYKAIEHMAVGLSSGYWVVLLFYGVAVPNIFDKLAAGEWWYIFPTILGLLMWTRLTRNWSWISRYPLAFYLGIATGVAIPLELRARVIEQLNGSVGLVTAMHGEDATFTLILNNILILGGVVTGLIYFYFSKEHKGATGMAAKLGIGILMVGFGAAFGYTVMGRIALLIGRVQFLMFDWLHWY